MTNVWVSWKINLVDMIFGVFNKVFTISLYMVEWQDDWWMMNLKRYGKKIIWKFCSGICRVGLRESVRNLSEYGPCSSRDCETDFSVCKSECYRLRIYSVELHWGVKYHRTAWKILSAIGSYSQQLVSPLNNTTDKRKTVIMVVVATVLLLSLSLLAAAVVVVVKVVSL
jgi:hypothetical protein